LRHNNDGIMQYLVRYISEKILEKFEPNKVILVLGARRVGKTMLI